MKNRYEEKDMSKSSRTSESSVKSRRCEDGQLKSILRKTSIETQPKNTVIINDTADYESNDQRLTSGITTQRKQRRTIFSTKNIYGNVKPKTFTETGTTTDLVTLTNVGTRTCNDLELKITKIQSTNTPKHFSYKYALKKFKAIVRTVCTQVSENNLLDCGMFKRNDDDVEEITDHEKLEDKTLDLEKDNTVEGIEKKSCWNRIVVTNTATLFNWIVENGKTCLIILILILMGVSTLFFIGLNVNARKGTLDEYSSSGKFLRGGDGLMRHESQVFLNFL